MASIEARARRAYERGRLIRASRRIWWPAPIAALSAPACCSAEHAWIAAGLAAIWILFCGWRGLDLERAIAPGFFAGLIAAAAPVVGRALGLGELTIEGCFELCLVGGALGGLWVGAKLRRAERPAMFLLGALPLAIGMGSVGCV